MPIDFILAKVFINLFLFHFKFLLKWSFFLRVHLTINLQSLLNIVSVNVPMTQAIHRSLYDFESLEKTVLSLMKSKIFAFKKLYMV